MMRMEVTLDLALRGEMSSIGPVGRVRSWWAADRFMQGSGM
jgi:hypothetical protein